MALVGMQADMQHKSHFPGCYTAWDLNSDANGAIWHTNNVDRILRNRQCYHGTLPRPSDLNMFYNKDLLKQTMLKHEEVFRDQIHELHRLYRRQKELMDEMKKNDLYKHPCSMETLQPNHVLFPKSSNYVQIPYHTSISVNLVHCQPRISEAKGNILPLRSCDGNSGQTGLDPTRIESSSKTSEFIESNCKRFGKKILDLELPADVYFDSEDEGFSEVKMAPEVTDTPTNALKKIPEVNNREDKELPISGRGCNFVFPEGNFVPSSVSSKKKVMADLNIPVKLKEDITDFQDPVIGHRETSLQDPSGRSVSNFHVLSEEVVPSSQLMRDREAHLAKQKMQRQCIPYNNKAGWGRNGLNYFPQDLYTEKLSIEHMKNEQARDCAVPHGLDETDGKLCHENLQHVARESVAISDMCNSYQIVPLADIVNSESSSVSSWKHAFKQSPIAVQALPCFKEKSSKSCIVSPRLAAYEFGKNLLSSPKMCSATFQQAGLQNDFQLDGQPPVTSSIPLNFNNDNDFAFEHNCSPQIAEMHVRDTKSGERRDLAIQLESALEQTNSLSVYDIELEKVEASKSLDFKRILGFHLSNKPPIADGQCSSHASSSRNHPNSCAREDIKDEEKARAPDMNLEFDHVPDSVKQLAKTEPVAESEPCEKYPVYGVIDLNSCLPTDESLLMPSHSIEIELEPPASPENKECSPPRGESDENQLETPLLSSGQEDGDLQEALVRNVVEAIVSISSSQIPTCSEITAREPFKASNSLYWFARVASSVVDDPGSEFGVNIGVKDYDDNEEYLSDGIDYFEAMTLNLTEIKVEEPWCKHSGQKEEESSVVFSTNPPKRGRTRRGRQQKKDFKSEILPSLASLSRHEVTEDLQTIGGLLEAAGARWETGSSRNAGRNGYNRKGRQRSNPCASNVTESTMNMLLKQRSGNREVGIQQHGRLIQWGKITRRPRGPRCPSTSSNLRVISGQV